MIVVTIAKCLDSNLPQSSHLAALRCISTHWKLYRHVDQPIITHHLAEQLFTACINSVFCLAIIIKLHECGCVLPGVWRTNAECVHLYYFCIAPA